MAMDFQLILNNINKNHASESEIDFFKRNVLNHRIDLLPQILMSSSDKIPKTIFKYWTDLKSRPFVDSLLEEFESLMGQGKPCKYNFRKFKSSIIGSELFTTYQKAVIIFFVDAPPIQIQQYPSDILNEVLNIQVKYPNITLGYKMESVIQTIIGNKNFNYEAFEDISNILAEDTTIDDFVKDRICTMLEKRPQVLKRLSSNALNNFIKISETLRMNAKFSYDLNGHHMVRKKFERLDALHRFIKNKSIAEFKHRTDSESVLLRLIH